MIKYFFPREPLSSNHNFEGDKLSLDEARKMWLQILKQEMGLVALLDEDENQFQIVGANITGISHKSDKHDIKMKGEWEKINKIINTITSEGNLFERYGVDSYLSAMGLSVHPEFHGLGLGLKLLECREKVCKHFNLKMTATVFTAASSQHIAKKCGFHTIVEHEYRTYAIDGEILYPNLNGKISLMAKVYT
ncbi:hypothetical protein AAG570_000442 [Ranatra chinensis]|uniref:N-acetyltransferase domain-containing protein n=1 Tax=Ranatra chinensis TaxID=642074 RepID=A0ABD0Z9S3_9HEMI